MHKTDVMMHTCKNCKKSFKNERLYKAHTSRNHLALPCSMCDKKFGSRSALNADNKMKHANPIWTWFQVFGPLVFTSSCFWHLLFSSVRSSNSHPDLLLIHHQPTHRSQITPVLTKNDRWWLGTSWALPGDNLGGALLWQNLARLVDTFGQFWHCVGIASRPHMMTGPDQTGPDRTGPDQTRPDIATY